MNIRVALAIAAAAFLPLANAQSAGKNRQVKQYTIQQFLDTENIGGASFSPDEKFILYSSNRTGIYNAYRLPIMGGAPEALTRSTQDTTRAISYFPKDERFLFTRDRGGNEMTHIYVRSADGSERDLTPGDRTKAMFAGWTRDLSGFLYLTNARDPRFFDLYRMDAATFTPSLVYQDTVGYLFSDISNDGKWIAFDKPKTTNDSDLYVYNIATKQMKHITPHEGNVANRSQTFSPDSRYLYFTTDEGDQFQYVARYELNTGKRDVVLKESWDVMDFSFSWNGKYRVASVNEDARAQITITETATGKPVRLTDLPKGDITSVTISRSEEKVAIYLSDDRAPSNLYVHEFGSKGVRRLTDTLSKAINPADLVESEVVRYPSFDKLQIPGILYKPHQATAQAKAPALVMVHGGPGGQARKGYNAQVQFLVNHGYVVLDVNNRGSSGYGKTFLAADDKKHGREPLWDCIEAKKYLASLGYVDPQRIGIIGGSYGGYMVLAALAFHPKEFTVGVDIFGVANWIRTLEVMPKWWEAQRKALYEEIGDPVKDKDMLMTYSPAFHGGKIERPLLVLQGANDPRVIKAESDDMVAAIRKKGGIVEYIVFDDEGHGFTKKANQIRGYQGILEFLDKHLKGGLAGA